MKVNPTLSYYSVENQLSRMKTVYLKNTELWMSIRKLVEPLAPDMKDKYDERWFGLYLPVKRSGREIALPMWVVRYRSKLIVGLSGLGNFEVIRGKQKIDRTFGNIILESSKFLRILKEHTDIVQKMVPYDIRTGKIKGKYVMDKTMTFGERVLLESLYSRHEARNLTVQGCSLNEYLSVAALCYRAAYRRKADPSLRLSPLTMYESHADGRHGGMLDIKDGYSRKEFMKWYNSSQWTGSHPFEIVFSWIEHGVHLFPPTEHNGWRYGLRVTNYGYAEYFVKMVKKLIYHGVPFQAYGLKDILDYMTGESYFTVNRYDRLNFYYEPSHGFKKKYFSHVEWDELELPKWKSSEA